jgi:hypothetical protein
MNQTINSIIHAHTLTIEPGVKVHLPADFLDPYLAQDVLGLFEYFDNDRESWKPIDGQKQGTVDRYQYIGNDSVFRKLKELTCHPDVLAAMEQLVGNPVKTFGDISLWLDVEGYKIPTHCDVGGWDYSLQIYFTRTEHPMLGTTINDLRGRTVVTLPFRNNFGYIFDKCDHVNHGLATAVPPGIRRYSLYARYYVA